MKRMKWGESPDTNGGWKLVQDDLKAMQELIMANVGLLGTLTGVNSYILTGLEGDPLGGGVTPGVLVVDGIPYPATSDNTVDLRLEEPLFYYFVTADDAASSKPFATGGSKPTQEEVTIVITQTNPTGATVLPYSFKRYEQLITDLIEGRVNRYTKTQIWAKASDATIDPTTLNININEWGNMFNCPFDFGQVITDITSYSSRATDGVWIAIRFMNSNPAATIQLAPTGNIITPDGTTYSYHGGDIINLISNGSKWLLVERVKPATPLNPVLKAGSFFLGDITGGSTGQTFTVPFSALTTINYYVMVTLVDGSSTPSESANVSWVISDRSLSSFSITIRELTGDNNNQSQLYLEYILFKK